MKQLDFGFEKLGGMSAVCHYSMLVDNHYTVYAISKDDAKEIWKLKFPLVPENETPFIIIHVMSYNLEYHEANAIDPSL